MARVSQMFDPLNRITIDAIIESKDVGERKRWKIVRQFYNSGKKEKIISLSAFPSSIKQCREMGLALKPLRLRLLRVELDTGEAEILITSLLNRDRYPIKEFAELYHLRWPVEEDYKAMD